MDEYDYFERFCTDEGIDLDDPTAWARYEEDRDERGQAYAESVAEDRAADRAAGW